MHIALVDTSRGPQESITPLLSAEGHEVLTYRDASDALSRLESDAQINALIAGAELSPVSAVELCRETRLLVGWQRELYVLLMSNGDRLAKIEALDCGADDIVDESPSLKELLAKLRMAERSITRQQELMLLATTDHLSRVCNRGAFFEELTKARQNLGGDESLSLLLLDIDCFKTINDSYGHDVGDKAIRAVADAARTFGSPVGRVGGDEFCILLKGHNLEQALIVAAALQQRLTEVRLETTDGPIRVTCSIGVSGWHSGDTVDDLMKRADLALYRAKDEGRDCIATTPNNSWMSQRPRLGVSLARLLPRPFSEVRERRNALPPSNALLARICAVIDLLSASGLSDEAAAQLMAQRMMAAGIPVPENVEAENWWQCILAWRLSFRNGTATDDALREYQDVVSAIESIAPHERVECVMSNDLWDRRRLVLTRHSASGFLVA